MNRRDFLKIGGMTLGVFLAMRGLARAGNVFISGHIGAAGGTTWANWNEIIEAGWGDSTNSYVALMENVSAGGNETGQGGGLTGTDLILTQGGNIAGATGSPPKRLFDNVDDYMTPTAAWASTLLGSPTHTLLVKANAVATNAEEDWVWMFTTDDNDYVALCRRNPTSGKLEFRADPAAGGSWVTVADLHPSTGDLYIFQRADGTNLYGGWSTTKPTSYAAVPAGQKVTIASAWTPAGTFNRQYFFSDDALHRFNGSVYYVLASKLDLIGA